MTDVSKTNEQAFESLIEKALVGSTCEERANLNVDIDNQHPLDNQYYWGNPKDMSHGLAIDMRRLWSFLEESQAEILSEFCGRNMRETISKKIARDVEQFGIIDVLRKGVNVDNIHLTLFYPKPSSGDSEIAKENYRRNQFSVTRQQTFSDSNRGLEIDMVIFVNGLPIFTFELKNPWTHQTAQYDGQNQYKSAERNPKEPLLSFGRCMAHFTMDKDNVYFTTRLQLSKTYFMPFNKGLENGQGAGNPINPNGYKTSYMWEKVLRKDVVADIIMNYALMDYDEVKTQKKVPHIMKNAKRLIFPRYHQLDVVQKLVEDVEKVGVGKCYLIEHSAGSGKSNSLTWLAYKLINLCPGSMDAVGAKALDVPLYNSAIVVTDRRLLDKQITDNINLFGNSEKIIAHADTSKKLQEAILAGKRIIITTIQKFPYICDSIANVNDHNFAILIDEAHSSQSGIAADKMNTTVHKEESEEMEDTDDLLVRLMKDRKMSNENCSYFAFTATPKKETLERFGTQDSEGRFHPFHLYSMKQAIDEGFILDVLTNYTTYRSYYELVKNIEDNPKYNNEKAQKLLRKTVEKDPKTIMEKADVMLTHFDLNIYRNKKLKGEARAMVVTKDIECAIYYYQAIRDMIEKRGMPYRVLISFSGEKEVKGVSYTEASINGFPEKETAKTFGMGENRILVVANKYLTGFDQPKLCAMYVDKPLAGVLAVQALSRLNRSAPELGKLSEDLFVLDFYNTLEDIKNAFDPYYTTTLLSESTDVNILHDLRATLLSMGVFDLDMLNGFIELYVHGESADKWSPIIDEAANNFNNVIEWDENGQADFKMKCKQFVKTYSRVASIIDYEVKDWEKLFWFLRFLIPQLKIKNPEKEGLKDLLDNVDLNTYGLRRTALNETIVLDSSEATVDPNKPTMVGASGEEEEKDPLDVILTAFNERWFKGWNSTPAEQREKIIGIVNAVANSDDYKNYVENNPDRDSAALMRNKLIDKVIRAKRKSDMSLYKQYLQNEGFQDGLRMAITQMLERK